MTHRAITMRIREIAETRIRYGCPRRHASTVHRQKRPVLTHVDQCRVWILCRIVCLTDCVFGHLL
ncbi:hypothetical protein QBK27_003628 [Salmonella enterica]|nr:hypothetical protein [Salmonella enterica]